MCKFMKGLFTKEWTMYDKVLIVTTAGLLGVVIGFLFSPIKKGLILFSDNGSNNGSHNGRQILCEDAKEKKQGQEKKGE